AVVGHAVGRDGSIDERPSRNRDAGCHAARPTPAVRGHRDGRGPHGLHRAGGLRQSSRYRPRRLPVGDARLGGRQRGACHARARHAGAHHAARHQLPPAGATGRVPLVGARDRSRRAQRARRGRAVRRRRHARGQRRGTVPRTAGTRGLKARTNETHAMTPLKNIRVLDFSKVLAGPLCAQHLGELGADVIKVEPPGVGDDARSWLPQDQGESAIVRSINHNKRSAALDLKSAEGVAIAHRLAREADVVLQGFGSGTAKKLRIDYETLSALNPRMVYLEISGYGRDGPLGKEPGYDVVLQAFSGMSSTMGEPGGPMARASFSPVDLSTGMNGVIGILAALLERERTGRGAYVEVS